MLKTLNLPTTIKDDDPRLKDAVPPFRQQVRAKSKELLIDEEVRRRKCVICLLSRYIVHIKFIVYHRAVKMNLANEGLEAKKKEEEVNAKKRKAEEDAAWEGQCVTVHLR